MLKTYKNAFYCPKRQGSQEYLSNNTKNAIEYKGYTIYENIKGIEYHIVKDDVCVGMFAGINGAKREIDNPMYLKLEALNQ